MFHRIDHEVSRPALIAWLIAGLACCAVTSCKSHDSLFGQPSPGKIASEYFSALASNPPGDAFWQYDARFAEQLASIKANVPESMWAQKRDVLRQQWQAQMSSGNTEAQQIGGEGPCWQLIRPGDSVKILETRDEAGSASDSSTPNSLWLKS
jgi:hypothetical protein